MSDRELLELAAKSYGVSGQYVTNYGSGDYYYQGNGEGILWEYPDGGYTVWNPLADDGDALRLAVRIGLCILIESGHVVCTRYYAEPQKLTPHGERLGDNAAAATRRAIVRAAAEIGRSMP